MKLPLSAWYLYQSTSLPESVLVSRTPTVLLLPRLGIVTYSFLMRTSEGVMGLDRWCAFGADLDVYHCRRLRRCRQQDAALEIVMSVRPHELPRTSLEIQRSWRQPSMEYLCQFISCCRFSIQQAMAKVTRNHISEMLLRESTPSATVRIDRSGRRDDLQI